MGWYTRSAKDAEDEGWVGRVVSTSFACDDRRLVQRDSAVTISPR
jgi:hypothetical protein